MRHRTRSTRCIVCGALFAGALVAFAATASAQDSTSASTFVESKTADGQDIRFKDDPMSALAGNPVGAQLSGFHPPHRFNLMPPRTSFVPQLLKSVEHL
jgi:hypothetical protein